MSGIINGTVAKITFRATMGRKRAFLFAITPLILLVVTALLTVAILALIGPYLLNVDLPHGLVGDWLIDKLALRAS